MDVKLIWLTGFVGIYWAYCLFWGFKGARDAKTSADYFLAGRSIGVWVFVLAATATSFSGWTFVGHPGKIFTDGLPYAFASFYALTIPLTGVLFLRRQWVLGKVYRYITPGEMYSDYYGGNAMRLLTVLVAFLFSVPYLGVQLRASGNLFNVLTDGLVSVNFGMFALTTVVEIYVASGGLKSVDYVDCHFVWHRHSLCRRMGWFHRRFGGYCTKGCFVRTKPYAGWIFNEGCYPRRYSNGIRWVKSNWWCVDGYYVYDLHVCPHGDSIFPCFFHVGFFK